MKLFVNFLTIFRIISAIVLPFAWEYLSPLYLIIYVSLTLFTDFLDGILARTFNVQSLFGCIMDTIADKVFGIAIILVLMGIYRLFYLILIMELIIMIINTLAVILGARTGSSLLGKSKMWVLSICIVISLLFYYQINFFNIFKYPDSYVVDMCIFITIGTQIIVIIDYIRTFLKEIKLNKKRIEYKKSTLKLKNIKELKYVLFNTPYFIENKNKPISLSLFK